MLSVRQLQFGRPPSFQLQAMDFDIEAGSIVSLIGPNGSGKSTLLRLLARLLQPERGEVVLNGQDIHALPSVEIARQLAMLPQMQDHQLDLTVQELVEFGRMPHKAWFERLSGEDQDIVQWAMGLTRLQGYEHRFLNTLSGGERQRAWIAMALAQRTQLLLLDEPTTYLDIAHQMEVMELVKMLNETYGMTILMVLHDINQAAQYSDRLLVLKKGQIEYDGNPECVLCNAMFEDVFGIEVEVHKVGEKPFFTPRKRCEPGGVACPQKPLCQPN